MGFVLPEICEQDAHVLAVVCTDAHGDSIDIRFFGYTSSLEQEFSDTLDPRPRNWPTELPHLPGRSMPSKLRERSQCPAMSTSNALATFNRHFQGNYKGQPEWLSETDIHPAARILRSHPDRSSSLRIRLHYQAGQWMCLNNRGFALHCLANLVPRRLAFDTPLKGEEEGRSRVQQDEFKRLNFKRAVPSSRRGIDCMDKTIPTQVTAVPITVNDSDVLYTVQAIGMDPKAAPDNGNETVFNSPECSR